MVQLLEIEKYILKAAQTPIPAGLLRRIVTHKFPDTSIRHNTINAYVDTLLTKGYIAPTDDTTTLTYEITKVGEQVIDTVD